MTSASIKGIVKITNRYKLHQLHVMPYEHSKEILLPCNQPLSGETFLPQRTYIKIQ